MATADDYADWIVKNESKKGTPDFDAVVDAYRLAKEEETKPKEKAPQEPWTTEAGRALKRGAGLTVRAGAHAIAGIPAMLADAATAIIPMTPEFRAKWAPPQAHALDKLLTRAGVNEAKTPAERVVTDMASAVGGVGAAAGAAAKGAPAVANFFGNQLGMQATSAALGSGAAGVTRESGGGPAAQTMAALLGSMSPAVAKTAVNTVFPNMTAAGRANSKGMLLNDAAGAQKQNVLEALAREKQFVAGERPTAAQAASEANAPAFAGLERLAVRKYNPNLSAARNAENNAARVAAVRSVGKDQAALDAAEALRTTETTPLRADALANANVAGQLQPKLQAQVENRFSSMASAMQSQGKLATEAAQQQYKANTWSPVAGQPRFPGRYAPHMENVGPNLEGAALFGNVAAQRRLEQSFRKYQLDSLSQNGHFPLVAKDVTDKLTAVMRTPGNKTNSTLQQALGDIKKTIRGATDENGVIDSRELYTIRKLEAGNVIDRLTAGNPRWDQKLTSGLLIDVKKAIDNAIEGAGGDTWKKYLATFAEKSRSIDQMKFGQFLEKKLTSPLSDDTLRPGVFAQALREPPADVMRYGNPLTTQQAGLFGNVKSSLEREALTNKQAIEGTTRARSIVGTELDSVDLPNWLSRSVTLARYALEHIGVKTMHKTLEELAKDLQDPQIASRLMREATPSQLKAIQKVIQSTQQPTGAGLFQVLPQLETQ